MQRCCILNPISAVCFHLGIPEGVGLLSCCCLDSRGYGFGAWLVPLMLLLLQLLFAAASKRICCSSWGHDTTPGSVVLHLLQLCLLLLLLLRTPVVDDATKRLQLLHVDCVSHTDC